MPIGLSDFIQAFPPIKYLLFLAVLTGFSIDINVFGVVFKISDVFTVPISAGISSISAYIGHPIYLTPALLLGAIYAVGMLMFILEVKKGF